jgi:hypothetical protein
MCLKSSSGIDVITKVRWGVRAPLKLSLGPVSGRGGCTSACLRWARTRLKPCTVRRSSLGIERMLRKTAVRALSTSSHWLGTRSGRHGSGGGAGAPAVGSVSSTLASISAAATPSAAE